MNNLYNWHDERMVQSRRYDLDRELADLNLLKEAGLADRDRLVRLGRKVSDGMLALARWWKERISTRYASFKPAHKKSI